MSELNDIEDLLRLASLAEPPPQLDRRMNRLFRVGWARLLPPAYGFAAGILATVSVMFAMSKPRAQPLVPAPQARVASPNLTTVWAVPRQAVDEIDGEINGVPVRLEDTRRQVDVWPANQSSGNWVTEVELPETVSINPIQNY
jgi:hypothetical protein